MMEAMNIMESSKGIRSFFTLLAALAVATVGTTLAMVMVGPAKPAHAAICYSSAVKPYLTNGNIGDDQSVIFKSSISCTGGEVSGFSMDIRGYKYYNGQWNRVDDGVRSRVRSERPGTGATWQVPCTVERPTHVLPSRP